jgi:2-methylisocitrate lyase-like PEP mutase family enzyme
MVKGGRIEQPTAALRRLLEDEAFVFLPVAYDALGARLVERLGFKAVYTDGFVTAARVARRGRY